MDALQAALAAKHGSEEAWAADAEKRLRDWGFNTAGPWSGRSILDRVNDAEPILDIVHRVPRPDGLVMDVFIPEYPDILRQLASERCAPRKDDPNLLGYFLDNELAWDNGWQTKKRLLRLHFEFPAGQPGRDVALAFLKESAGGSLAAFNAAWKADLASWDDLPAMKGSVLEPATPEAAAAAEAFAVKVLDRYAGEAVKAIREADPNHLVLGCRFNTWHFDGLMAAAAKHFDVVSLAYYWETPPVDHLDRAAPAIDRPFLLEEWSFKATDSGLMNVMNFAPVVDTQKDRGLAYERYVEALIRRPWVVAYHWYKWFDNPSDPDNLLKGDNFGLMDQDDDPYLPLVRMASEVNRRAEAWHLEGVP
jgi:agarase